MTGVTGAKRRIHHTKARRKSLPLINADKRRFLFSFLIIGSNSVGDAPGLKSVEYPHRFSGLKAGAPTERQKKELNTEDTEDADNSWKEDAKAPR